MSLEVYRQAIADAAAELDAGAVAMGAPLVASVSGRSIRISAVPISSVPPALRVAFERAALTSDARPYLILEAGKVLEMGVTDPWRVAGAA